MIAYPNMTPAACCPHALRGSDIDPSLLSHHAPSSSVRTSSNVNTGTNSGNIGSSSRGGGGGVGGSFASTAKTGRGRAPPPYTSLIETKRRKHWRIFSDPVAHLPDIYVHEKTGGVQTGEPYDLRCHRLQRTMVREQWSGLYRTLWYANMSTIHPCYALAIPYIILTQPVDLDCTIYCISHTPLTYSSLSFAFGNVLFARIFLGASAVETRHHRRH